MKPIKHKNDMYYTKQYIWQHDVHFSLFLFLFLFPFFLFLFSSFLFFLFCFILSYFIYIFYNIILCCIVLTFLLFIFFFSPSSLPFIFFFFLFYLFSFFCFILFCSILFYSIYSIFLDIQNVKGMLSAGIEPATLRTSVSRSTSWAKRAFTF